MPTRPKKSPLDLYAQLISAVKEPPVPTNKTGKPLVLVRYKKASKSAKGLSKMLGAVPQPTAMVSSLLINWGSGSPDYFYGVENMIGSVVLNPPKVVNLCRNKMRFFKAAQAAKDGPRTPKIIVTADEAVEAVKAGVVVFGRKETGSCGTDIVLYGDDPGAFVASDFWSVYKKKKSEYRVHVFKMKKGYESIDVQQKVLRKEDPETGKPLDVDKVNFMIRSHRNGFIFQRNNLEVPKDVFDQALKAAEVTGIDFGAIDVLWNESEGKAYVLEVNTAPGLEGTTLENYAKAFTEVLGL